VTLRIRGDALPAWAIEELGSVTPDRIYTVATNSYVPGHLERYFPDGILGTVDSGRPMRDTVIDADGVRSDICPDSDILGVPLRPLSYFAPGAD